MRNPGREKPALEKETSQEKGIFKSETAEKIEALKKMRELVEQKEPKEPKEFVSLEEAEKILGQENVLGPADVEKYMLSGRKLEEVLLKEEKEELEKIKEIPYSKKELERAKDWGEILVLRSSLVVVEDIPSRGRHNRFLPNIAVLRRKFPEYFSKQEQWFSGENFFIDVINKFEWKLVRKEPTILGSSYSQQEDVITNVKKHEEGFEKYERRRPVEIVYDTILYWLKNGKPPLENSSDWSSEKLSDKKVVRVGVEKEETFPTIPGTGGQKIKVSRGEKIVIGSNDPNSPQSNLGVCPQR